MAVARIICIGNRYSSADWLGPAVFAALADHADARTEVIDGGLLGLNLLPLLENVERVVFADTLTHVEQGITVLAEPQPDNAAIRFDHAGGLAALLGAAPLVLDRLPRIWLAGAAANAPRTLVPALAQVCLQLARQLECHGDQQAYS